MAEKWVVVAQITAATLGIPVAAAGAFSAYQNYFATETSCRHLRTGIIATMERHVADETKLALLRKDVDAFIKACGDSDPDARSVLQALYQPKQTVAAAGPATVGIAPQAAILSAPDAAEHLGWVALNRREDGKWSWNFSGYPMSEATLPPAGTVLNAQRTLPIWSEPQGTQNDQSKYRSSLLVGTCVRVVGARGGHGRLWAEVAAASCP